MTQLTADGGTRPSIRKPLTVPFAHSPGDSPQEPTGREAGKQYCSDSLVSCLLASADQKEEKKAHKLL